MQQFARVKRIGWRTRYFLTFSAVIVSLYCSYKYIDGGKSKNMRIFQFSSLREPRLRRKYTTVISVFSCRIVQNITWQEFVEEERKNKNINVVIAIISNWNCYQTRGELKGDFSIWGKHTFIWKFISSFHIEPKKNF